MGKSILSEGYLRYLESINDPITIGLGKKLVWALGNGYGERSKGY